MISLRVWLLTLLLALPFYAYSLNYEPRAPQEDVFEKRDLDEVREDIEKRQQIETNSEALASISSVLLSLSDVIRSYSENPDSFTANSADIEASISSAILSVSSDLFPIEGDTTTPIETETTPITSFSGYTTPQETATPGQVITDGTRTGTVGEDGTTRFCSASSYLCPASVSYGCCKDGYRCGLTACTPTGGTTPATTSAESCSSGSFLCPSSVGGGCCPSGYECGLSACTPTGGVNSPTQSKTTFSFDPAVNTDTPKNGGDGNTNGGTTNGGSSSSGLSGGAIGGIVGGVVGGIALLAGGLVWFCLGKRRKQKTTPLPANGTTGPNEQYTGGPIPPQPQMAQYNSPTSPPPHNQGYQSPPPQGPGGFYQPYNQQYPAQHGPPGPGGYPQYGQNVSELGGAAMPYGQKGVDQPHGIQEAPANPAPTSPGAPQNMPPQKGATGPVYELG